MKTEIQIDSKRTHSLATTTPGTVYSGTYLGSRSVPTANGVRIIHDLEDGVPYSIWGATALDMRLAKVNIGTQVTVTYLGLGKTASGRPLHTVRVEIDE